MGRMTHATDTGLFYRLRFKIPGLWIVHIHIVLRTQNGFLFGMTGTAQVAIRGTGFSQEAIGPITFGFLAAPSARGRRPAMDIMTSGTGDGALGTRCA